MVSTEQKKAKHTPTPWKAIARLNCGSSSTVWTGYAVSGACGEGREYGSGAESCGD
jgi:hypothetical protein